MKKYCYDYPMASLTVDIVLISSDKKVLFIKRGGEPFKGEFAFPGGFVESNEGFESAAYRELKEETGISDVKLYQFESFGNPNRDPRGRTVSVVFVGLLRQNSNEIVCKAADDASDLAWIDLKTTQKLAFDHNLILSRVIEELAYQNF